MGDNSDLVADCPFTNKSQASHSSKCRQMSTLHSKGLTVVHRAVGARQRYSTVSYGVYRRDVCETGLWVQSRITREPGEDVLLNISCYGKEIEGNSCTNGPNKMKLQLEQPQHFLKCIDITQITMSVIRLLNNLSNKIHFVTSRCNLLHLASGCK